MDKLNDTLNHLFSPFLVGLLVVTGLGLIIGLEREIDKQHKGEGIAGIRTFPIMAILGYIAGFISANLGQMLLLAFLPGIIVFLGVVYFAKSRGGDLGLTTSLSLLLIFILGIVVSMEYIREALAATVITVTLLSLKEKFREVIPNITQKELYAFVKFVILALLILPFLPNEDYGPDGILNPMAIGTVVVVVSALSFGGYVLVKFGSYRKGVLLTALLGGLFSSTAVSWIYASRSKENPEQSGLYAAGVVLASAIMFIRVVVLAAFFNTAILSDLWLPCTAMFVAGMLSVWFIMSRTEKTATDEKIALGNPLDLLNALYFAAIFTGVSLMVYYSNVFFGTGGLYATGVLSGLADVDAITISMTKFAADNSQFQLAVSVIVIAMLSNTLVKLFITLYRGAPRLKRLVALGFAPPFLVGLGFIFYLVFRS